MKTGKRNKKNRRNIIRLKEKRATNKKTIKKTGKREEKKKRGIKREKKG